MDESNDRGRDEMHVSDEECERHEKRQDCDERDWRDEMDESDAKIGRDVNVRREGGNEAHSAAVKGGTRGKGGCAEGDNQRKRRNAYEERDGVRSRSAARDGIRF